VSELIVRFGKRVKELRKSIGITQDELAERVEVSKDYIGLIERGLRSPSLQTVEKIAISLKVSITSLFEYPPE
jgi:transcriptional regulator with XRE-family HTH domain